MEASFNHSTICNKEIYIKKILLDNFNKIFHNYNNIIEI